ncbi:hypothetical protein PMIN07_005935 [Paraphaeosphaeria minitans]
MQLIIWTSDPTRHDTNPSIPVAHPASANRDTGTAYTSPLLLTWNTRACPLTLCSLHAIHSLPAYLLASIVASIPRASASCASPDAIRFRLTCTTTNHLTLWCRQTSSSCFTRGHK